MLISNPGKKDSPTEATDFGNEENDSINIDHTDGLADSTFRFSADLSTNDSLDSTSSVDGGNFSVSSKPKFIVFESSLKELFWRSPHCRSVASNVRPSCQRKPAVCVITLLGRARVSIVFPASQI